MVTKILPNEARSAHGIARRVLLIWQNPKSRAFVKIGQLEIHSDGHFDFRYLSSAQNQPNFTALAQFPNFDDVYSSSSLPAFFANRVMSRQRENYGEYLGWLGIAADCETPVEVLVRSGGARATDTFHIVDDLRMVDGQVVSRFLASGIRHVPGATERLEVLQAGQELLLRDEPTNPMNQRALLIDAEANHPVGYVPDWLLDDVHLLRSVSEVRILAERVNPDAPAHLQLLCRLEAKSAEVTSD